MGQKVNPNGLRFGININWQSRWNAKDNAQMGKWLVEDDKIRKFFLANYAQAVIDHVEIERTETSISLFIYAAQYGVLIGQQGKQIEVIKKDINKIVGRKIRVNIDVIGIDAPELCARIVAREIADAIEKRVSFRNAQKAAIKKVMKAGAKGIKTLVSGRLGGVEMARDEGYAEGFVPLTTLRANIDYSIEEAHTTYGIIGVKVWINRGEIFGKEFRPAIAPAVVQRAPRTNSKGNGKKPYNRPRNNTPKVAAENTESKKENN